MEIQEYVNKLKKLYEAIMVFLSESSNQNESKFIKNIFDKHIILYEKYEHKRLLLMISKIADYHHKTKNLIGKVKIILQYYLPQIKQIFTDLDIFNIFIYNKQILLFLIEQKIIKFDSSIIYIIKTRFIYNQYKAYFYPEIKDFLNENELKYIEEKLNYYLEKGQDFFIQNRKIGENDSKICEYIRQDSIEEFVVYVNQYNIPLSSKIRSSIFETNPYFIKNTPTIIEYAIFFGSIQIIQYLLINNVELTPNLWICAIHSNNAEMINLLEENQVKPPNNDYEYCLQESIKCHHNEVSNYIIDNLIDKKNSNYSSATNLYIIKYFNYSFFSKDLIDNFNYNIKYFYEYGYYKLVKLCLKYYHIDINKSFYYDTLNLAAFKNDLEIVDLLLQQEGARINDNNFCNNLTLTNFKIPSSVTYIGKYAFYKCSSLKSVKIESFIESIEKFTFYCCTSLTSINIPSSVKSIGNNAFHGCSSLEHITIPPSVTHIGIGAFYNCTSLKSIEISSSEIYIGEGAFYGCSSLKSIEILSYKAYIGNSVFLDCPSIKNIKILSHLVSFGESSFSDCSMVENIEIPFALNGFLANCPFVDLSKVKCNNKIYFHRSLSHTNHQIKTLDFNHNVMPISEKAFANCLVINGFPTIISSSPLNSKNSFSNIDILLKWYRKWKKFYEKL